MASKTNEISANPQEMEDVGMITIQVIDNANMIREQFDIVITSNTIGLENEVEVIEVGGAETERDVEIPLLADIRPDERI